MRSQPDPDPEEAPEAQATTSSAEPPASRDAPGGRRDPESTNQVVALVAASAAAFITPFMGSAVNIALPVIGAEFHLGAVRLGWVTSAFLLAAAVFLLPVGRLSDILGRKRFFVAGMAVFTVSSTLCALAPSGNALIAARLVEGFGGALIFGTGTAILTSVFPPGRLGRALGINVAAVYLGLSLGPFLGGLLTQHFGWRSVYWSVVPVALLGALLTAWKLEGEWAGARGERFDLLGAVLYGGALVALMIGLADILSTTGRGLTGVGAIGLLAFVVWEGHATAPLLDLGLFRRNVVFALSNLAALINYSATYGVPFLLSLFLQYIRGLGPEAAGTVLVAQPVIMTVFSPAAGWLSERVEPRYIASAGMALTALGLFLLAGIGPATGEGHILGVLALLGFGFALFSSPNTNAVMSAVEPRFYGVASGTLGTMRLLGQMSSMALVVLTFSILIGVTAITPARFPAFLEATHVAFVVFGATCALGVLASLARGRVR